MAEITPGLKEIEVLEKANRYMPGGSNGNLSRNVIISRGLGARVWDLSGNEYVDYLLGSGPMIVGHAHPDVILAVAEQLENGTTFFALNEHAILLAEEIVRAVPCAEKVRFLSSGTEATLYAMRVARAYRKRDKILKFEGGYHGMSDYALMSMAPTTLHDFPSATPDSAGIPLSVRSEMLIAPFNDFETTSAIVERHHNEMAGVIVEPFQRVIPPAPGFLEGLREITRHYEIPLIFDEIVTGFRFSYGGAQEYYGVTPDLCTLGKTVAGGFPLAAVTGRKEIMNLFNPDLVSSDDQVPQIGTLSGNPIAAVAGLATLKLLRLKGTYERLFVTGHRIKDSLQQLLDEAEVSAKVVGEAPLFDVFFADNNITDYRSTLGSDKEKLGRFNRLLLRENIFKGDSKYYVSTVHSDDDVNVTVAGFKAAISELRS